MPQLAVETFPSQLFWLAISFVGLWLLMQFVALPRVGKNVEARRSRIDADRAAAVRLRQEAEAVLAEYEKAVAAARATAQATVRAAIEQINSAAIAREQALNERLGSEAKAAEARITAVKNEALGNLADLVRDVARDATSKLLGRPPDEAVLERAIAASARGRH